MEQSSVLELQSLLTRTIEALSFVLLLNDYRLGELIFKYVTCRYICIHALMGSRCEPDVQKLIDSLTYEDLITSQHGMTISRALVNVVIDQQIGQQISVCFIFPLISHYSSWVAG